MLFGRVKHLPWLSGRHIRAWLLCVFALIIFTAIPGFGDGSKLAIGDVIGVTVDGEKEFTKPYEINKNGCISLPMVGEPAYIKDLNTSDASGVVKKALGHVLVNPQVTVMFIERAKMRVYVVGQVKKPGLIEIGNGDRVVQALAQAGYDETADIQHVSIRRGDQTITLDLQKYIQGGDSSVNEELQSGDTVVVPRTDMIGTVFVLGQVNKVGSIPLRRGMTFREAMGLIGGVTTDSDTDHVTIKREGISEPIQLDYKKAMEGDKTADVPLQPGDAIFVPAHETAFFTVMGGVNRPGQYPLKGKITLSEAVGLAGGPIPNIGDLRKVQLARVSNANNNQSQTFNVDLTKIMKDPSQEVDVKRGDVIYVAQHKDKVNILQLITSLAPFAWLLK